MCFFMKWSRETTVPGFPVCEAGNGLACTGLASCETFYTCAKVLSPASRCDLATCTRPCAFREFKIRAVQMTNWLGKQLLKDVMEGTF